MTKNWNSPPWTSPSKCWGWRSGWTRRRKLVFRDRGENHNSPFQIICIGRVFLKVHQVKFFWHSFASNKWAAMYIVQGQFWKMQWHMKLFCFKFGKKFKHLTCHHLCFESIVKFDWSLPKCIFVLCLTKLLNSIWEIILELMLQFCPGQGQGYLIDWKLFSFKFRF